MAARLNIVLRDADREDAAALIDLWHACSRAAQDDHEAAAVLWRESAVPEAAEAIDMTLAHPERKLIVALVDGEIVGVISLWLTTISPINLTRTLAVTELHVMPKFRRKLVASTLLSAAASFGDENNCEIVSAVAPAVSREAHRYLTKLGFSQIATVRAISSSMLRSRLSMKATNSRETGRLIAVRRTLRRRESDLRKSRPRN